MYYFKLTGSWNHIYINYLPAIEYTYLNLNVEATKLFTTTYDLFRGFKPPPPRNFQIFGGKVKENR